MMARARKQEMYPPLVIKLDGIRALHVERYLTDEERRLEDMRRQLCEQIKVLRRARCFIIKTKRAARRKKQADKLRKSTIRRGAKR